MGGIVLLEKAATKISNFISPNVSRNRYQYENRTHASFDSDEKFRHRINPRPTGGGGG